MRSSLMLSSSIALLSLSLASSLVPGASAHSPALAARAGGSGGEHHGEYAKRMLAVTPGGALALERRQATDTAAATASDAASDNTAGTDGGLLGGAISAATSQAGAVVSGILDPSSSEDTSSTASTSSTSSASSDTAVLTTPTTSSSSSSPTSSSAPTSASTTSSDSASSAPTTSARVSSGAASSNVLSTSTSTLSLDSLSATESSSSASASASAAASSDDDDATVGGMSRPAFIAIIVVASCVAAIIAVWTIIRKTKFSPSRKFEAKLEPLSFKPGGGRKGGHHDDDDMDNFFAQHERKESYAGSHRSGSLRGGAASHLGYSPSVTAFGGLPRSQSPYAPRVPQEAGHAGFGTSGLVRGNTNASLGGAAQPSYAGSLHRSDSGNMSTRGGAMAEQSYIPGSIPYSSAPAQAAPAYTGYEYGEYGPQAGQAAYAAAYAQGGWSPEQAQYGYPNVHRGASNAGGYGTHY